MKEAMLYEKKEDKKVVCRLCSHNCQILRSKTGICRVRKNQDGVLQTLVYGQAVASAVDPIEKKPLYHFLPGTFSYSLATIGCNFKCGFCQNWQISQGSLDGLDTKEVNLLPSEIVKKAKDTECASISYTYTEPTIFFEYAYDTAKLAKSYNLKNIFVTNGYMSKDALKTISPYLDAANVDLKSFREEFYIKNCKAHLKPVLETIKLMMRLNIWVEVTTLIIPGENDSQTELKDIANFIASLDVNIPWHISRFHQDYNFLDYEPTPLKTLKLAYNLAKEVGLRYVYLGNVTDQQGLCTDCYNCKKLIIERNYLSISKHNIDKGNCPFCGVKIAGVFS